MLWEMNVLESLLDHLCVKLLELICHISSLASVNHEPPTSFVEGKAPIRRITLQPRAEL